MSVRFQGVWATGVAVEAMAAGAVVGGERLDQPALVFNTDEVLVVKGTAAQLADLIGRAHTALAKLEG
jgi:hypothetical protein